jgi:hypothetical protein
VRRATAHAALGAAVAVSRGLIVYRYGDEVQPPGAMLVDLAKTLKVTSSGLLAYVS